ncbi:MAG: putative molybdenum carrier protein [Chromatiales bacterium]|nr:putative molybdenum carrier protein [Chromatiales bacterium]
MITRLISGGQTGADRAALDAARELGIETGGWVPRGRRAEDGRVPECYPNMKETDSADPAVRTECNVRDSDGTVVFSHGEVSGGTKWTVEVSGRLRKPLLCLDLSTQPMEAAADRLLEWTAAEGVEVLNVAGPRASEDAAIHSAVRAVLGLALGGTPVDSRRGDDTLDSAKGQRFDD